MPAQREELTLTGYQSEALPHLFLRQEKALGSALVLPGMGYGLAYPGLHYPIQLLAELGYDVLGLESRYANVEFLDADESEQRAWLSADAGAALAAVRAATPGIPLCLMGKSVGTVGMASLLQDSELPVGTRLVWLTPLLMREEVWRSITRSAESSLVVIGTADSAYRPEWLDELRRAGAEMLVLEGADHSFRVADDVSASLDRMGELLGRLAAFLAPRS